MRKLTIHVTRGGNVLPDRGFCLMDPNGDVYVAYRQDDPHTCWQYAEEVYSKPRQTLEAQGWAVVEVELPNAQPDNAHFGQQVGMQAMAEPIVRRRSESLNSDVDHCIHREPYAPFPALLYCFATVDCLAALYAGNTGKGQQGANARVYMTEVMTYTEEQVRLLQAVYRHKLVHLAEPKSVIADAGRLVSLRPSTGRATLEPHHRKGVGSSHAQVACPMRPRVFHQHPLLRGRHYPLGNRCA